jgi:hypothetical protein
MTDWACPELGGRGFRHPQVPLRSRLPVQCGRTPQACISKIIRRTTLTCRSPENPGSAAARAAPPCHGVPYAALTWPRETRIFNGPRSKKPLLGRLHPCRMCAPDQRSWWRGQDLNLRPSGYETSLACLTGYPGWSPVFPMGSWCPHCPQVAAGVVAARLSQHRHQPSRAKKAALAKARPVPGWR